jgi:hypothetical protein
MYRLEYSCAGRDYKGNRYIVICNKDFIRLRCVWFCEPENLGDGIMCNQEGDCDYICYFHFQMMQCHIVELYRG